MNLNFEWNSNIPIQTQVRPQYVTEFTATSTNRNAFDTVNWSQCCGKVQKQNCQMHSNYLQSCSTCTICMPCTKPEQHSTASSLSSKTNDACH
jgi:hypothetical protein